MTHEYIGKVICGLSAASGEKKRWDGCGSIELQMKWLQKNNPDVFSLLRDCQPATINLVFLTEIQIVTWDYLFNINWLPNCKTWYEKIAFKKCKLLVFSKVYDAWIYKPFRSPHKDEKNFLEILAPYINGLALNVECRIVFVD